LILAFGIRIKFIQPEWVAIILSVLWVVGITNSINLIDIMDGLAAGTILVASLGFLFISLPTEEIYVNFAAAALAGSVLGFLPFNLSRKHRIFMGDSGSLFIGFVASALALGTSYRSTTDLSVLAPLFILAIPIYDTINVFVLRIRRGTSPFLGSKDHFPLRMEIMGWSRPRILMATLFVGVLFTVGAYFVTRSSWDVVLGIYLTCVMFLIFFTNYILKAKVR